MLKYILKRLMAGALTVFVLATITFFLMKLVPGSPFGAELAQLRSSSWPTAKHLSSN